MSRHHRRHRRFKLRSLYVWHRYMGVGAAIFVLLIAATGLLLNHTEDFQFDSRYIRSGWVLDWYGIHAPETSLSFSAHDQYVTLMGEHLYLDLKEIDSEYDGLVGAVYLNDLLVVAFNDALLLLTDGGDIVERLSGTDGVPPGIQRVGVDDNGRLVLNDGADYYQGDKDFLTWRRWEKDPRSTQWVEPAPLDARLEASLREHYRGEVLPLERVILDLHSGRFFGNAGPWLFDLAAVVLLLLSLTGTFIWLKRKR